MYYFFAEIVFGDLVLKEHKVAKWLTKDDLDSMEWLLVEVKLFDKIKIILKEKIITQKVMIFSFLLFTFLYSNATILLPKR